MNVNIRRASDQISVCERHESTPAHSERAVVGVEAGTITIAFGADLHDDPDALITVTETTGKFSGLLDVRTDLLRWTACAGRGGECRG